MHGRVPYRLGALVLVVDCRRGLRGDAWGDGVDVLPVGERVAVPPEMRREIRRGFGHPGADNEPQTCLVQFPQVRGREHPGVGDDDHVGDAVAFLELFHDRHDREGLGLGAFEAADLEGEAVSVDQEANDDLWVDATFLGVADLAQVVFLLGFEVEGGHVVEHQGDVTVGGGMGEAGLSEGLTVATGVGASQGPFAG